MTGWAPQTDRTHLCSTTVLRESTRQLWLQSTTWQVVLVSECVVVSVEGLLEAHRPGIPQVGPPTAAAALGVLAWRSSVLE